MNWLCTSWEGYALLKNRVSNRHIAVPCHGIRSHHRDIIKIGPNAGSFCIPSKNRLPPQSLQHPLRSGNNELSDTIVHVRLHWCKDYRLRSRNGNPMVWSGVNCGRERDLQETWPWSSHPRAGCLLHNTISELNRPRKHALTSQVANSVLKFFTGFPLPEQLPSYCRTDLVDFDWNVLRLQFRQIYNLNVPVIVFVS